LTEYKIASIKKTFSEVFKDGDVYLFSSRVDNNKRGGDIDIYLCPIHNQDDSLKKKIKFLLKHEDYIGEQKIDVIISKDKTRLIEKDAL